MSIEIKVPALPESVTDAVVATWHRKAGDAVSAGDHLLDLETDKVMLEVPAPTDGVLASILVEEGTTVEADAVLATMTEGAAPASDASPAVEAPSEAATNDTKAQQPEATHNNETHSPSVRRAIDAHGVDPSTLQGTGKGGRLTRTDVERGAATGTAPSATSPMDSTVLGANVGRQEKRVPMSRMRARIAERLLSAKNNTAMLTTFNEINMQPVMDIRTRYKEAFEKKHGVKLGFMSFFIKAVTEALKRFPAINASLDGNDILYHDYFDVGVAISAPRGLVVPVLRDVDQMSLADIEAGIIAYAKRAKDNQLTIEEMTGGTFTVTNGGVFGSMLSTPLLNPPQCAILGMHNIVKRPVVEDDNIVIRPMMYVALSYDHQLVDGRESVQFLVTIKSLLEHPEQFLLDL